MGAPLIIGPIETAELAELRQRAVRAPLDVIAIRAACETAEGRRKHLAHMAKNLTMTIPGPWPYVVSFSIETGHPVGPCRHMSMSINRRGRAPNEHAVWMVAEMLGFVGGLDRCVVWLEDIGRGDKAVNIAQPIGITAAGSA
jgi:hypothetical protein